MVFFIILSLKKSIDFYVFCVNKYFTLRLKAHHVQMKSLDKANDDKLLLGLSSNVYGKIPLDKIPSTHQHSLVV